MLFTTLFSLALVARSAAQSILSSNFTNYPDGSDLTQFVTRPEITAPRYVVTKHRPDAIQAGYWFVSPYPGLGPAGQFPRPYIPCQSGPHIYDSNGVLVWSSACKYKVRDTWDFQPLTINGKTFFTFHHQGKVEGFDVSKLGAGVILDENYNEYEEITQESLSRGNLNFHEFNFKDDGRTFILSMNQLRTMPVNDPELDATERTVVNPGFLMVDLATNETLFDWNALDHEEISTDESMNIWAKENKLKGNWDAFHINSIDRDDDGDFYVSFRHTSKIYKVSGVDGSVVWRLGVQGDFELGNGVEFLWQHHIRFLFKNETHTVVSLLDNGGDDHNLSLSTVPRHTSAGKVIILDETRMTADLLRYAERPDKGISEQLGSVQLLGFDPSRPETIQSASMFVGWGHQGYLSEFDSQGNLVLEAQFMSDRQKSYRAYKHHFVGKPLTKPDVKLLPVSYMHGEMASAFYVSWNGATEVKTWAFFGSESEQGPFHKLSDIKKAGFETAWVAPGKVSWGYAEAFDGTGSPLGRSPTVRLEDINDATAALAEGIFPESFASDGTTWQTTHEGDSLDEGAAQQQETSSPHDDPTASEGERFAMPELLSLLVHLVIYGFAAFGVFSAVKGPVSACWSKRRESWYSGIENGKSLIGGRYTTLGQSDEMLNRNDDEDDQELDYVAHEHVEKGNVQRTSEPC